MLTIARTLMGNPSLLLLDEPSEGLAPRIVEQMIEAIRQMKREGLSHLLSEQNLASPDSSLSASMSSRKGAIRFVGTVAEFDAEPDVRNAYLAFEPAGGAAMPVIPGNTMKSPAIEGRRKREEPYVLDDKVGFVLRQAQQRHTTIFATEMIEGLTPTQWAALAKLRECGPCSQNHLGRLTAMDAATIKGVIDRLTPGAASPRSSPDPRDGRRLLVALTPAGSDLYDRAAPIAALITQKTLEPLDKNERSSLVALLRRLA